MIFCSRFWSRGCGLSVGNCTKGNIFELNAGNDHITLANEISNMIGKYLTDILDAGSLDQSRVQKKLAGDLGDCFVKPLLEHTNGLHT